MITKQTEIDSRQTHRLTQMQNVRQIETHLDKYMYADRQYTDILTQSLEDTETATYTGRQTGLTDRP